jgi:PPOX class probable F420-dependent enzyme
MPKLDLEAIRAFLDEPSHLMRLATVDEDGTPRIVPIWYQHEDGELFFTPRAGSIWLRNLRRDMRIGISIDETAMPCRKVTVQGLARIAHDLGEDDSWRDLYRRMAHRYIGQDAGDAYVDDTDDQPRVLVAIALDSSLTRLSSWRMPIGDEDVSTAWDRRYWAEGSRMAKHIESGDARRMYGA